MKEDRPVEPCFSDEDPEQWFAIAEWEAARADNAEQRIAELEAQNKTHYTMYCKYREGIIEADRRIAELEAALREACG